MAIPPRSDIDNSLNYDYFTGEIFSTSLVTEYFDGSAMDDTKIDNAIYFKSASGYTKRNYSGPVNVKWFGARGDGLTDDTHFIQKALDITAHMAIKTLTIPEGIYMIQAIDPLRPPNASGFLVGVGGINVPSNITLVMDNETYLKAIPSNHVAYNILRIQQVSDVVVNGGNIVGDRYALEKSGVGGEWGYGVAILAASNVVINRVRSIDCWGDGFNLQVVEDNSTNETTVLNNSDITFNDCIADNNRRQGLSLEGGARIRFNACTFSNTKGTAPSAGIDIEPYNANNLVDGVEINHCRFYNNESRNLLIYGAMIKNVFINDCIFTGVPDSGAGLGLEHVTTGYIAENIIFRRCTFDNNVSQRGGTVRGGINIVFDDCTFFNCGMQINEDGDTDDFVTYDFTIKNSRIRTNDAQGIIRGIGGAAANCKSYTLYNNIFDFTGYTPFSFIYTNAYRNVFKNNQLVNLSVPLIIGVSNDTEIVGNDFYGCATYAIECRINTLIQGNNFYMCGNRNTTEVMPTVIYIRNIASNIRILNNVYNTDTDRVKSEDSAILAVCFLKHDNPEYGFSDIEVINNILTNKSAPTTPVIRTWSNEDTALMSSGVLYKHEAGQIICKNLTYLYRGVKPSNLVYFRDTGGLILIITPFIFDASGNVLVSAGYVTVHVV
jgi:hypothetical protein